MLAAYFHTILFMSHYFVLSPDISIKKQYEETLFNYIKRKFIHLLIPYYLWNFTYGIVTQILLLIGFSIGSPLTFHNLFLEPFVSGHQFIYNLAYWFVPALFLVEITNASLRYCLKKHMRNKFINTLFYLAIGIVGISLSFSGKHNGIWLPLVRTMFLLPTYQFGILYKSSLEKREAKSNLLYFGFLIAFQLCLYLKGFRLVYEVVFCQNFTGYILPYITIITGLEYLIFLNPLLKKSKILAFLVTILM